MTTEPVRPGSDFGGQDDRQLGVLERTVHTDQRDLVRKPEAPGPAIVEQGSPVLGVLGVPEGVAGGAKGDRATINPPVVNPCLIALAVVDDGKRLIDAFIIDYLDLPEQVERIRAGAVVKDQPEDGVAGVQLPGPV